MAESQKTMDILLIGKTGNGKSATGNVILGRKSFKSIASSTSVTKDIQSEYSEVNGRIIKVVDGPGVGDTDLSDEGALNLVISSVQKAIAANPEGYHAFCLVVRFGGRFTKEDSQTVQLLKGVFGLDFVKKFCILLVTCGDNYDPEETETRSFEDWCSKQSGVFKTLVDECGGRVILFDNRTKDEAKLKDQRDRLMKMVDALSVLGLRYSDEHFRMAQRERDRILVESKEPVLRQETMMETSLIIQQLGQLKLEDPEQQLVRLENLKFRADSLAKNIKDQDMGTGALADIMRNVKNIQMCVEEQIKGAERAIEEEERGQRLREEMERMRAEQQEHFNQLREEDKQRFEQEFTRIQQEEEVSRQRMQEMSKSLKLKSVAVEDEYMGIRDEHSIMSPSHINMIGHALGLLIAKGIDLLFKATKEEKPDQKGH